MLAASMASPENPTRIRTALPSGAPRTLANTRKHNDTLPTRINRINKEGNMPDATRESALRARNNDLCELCGSADNLTPLAVAPARDSGPDDHILACAVCQDQINNQAELVAGDAVTLTRDLDVKGTSFVAKRGTLVKGIRLTDNPELIEGRVNKVLIVIKTYFLKKA